MSMAESSPRRRFLIKLGQVGALSTTGGMVWNSFLYRSKTKANSLRPPGALAEQDFLAACIKCGQCVTACPFKTLVLTRTGEDGQIGTPRFVAREVPCYMCEDVPCAGACPTGALDRSITIGESRMGLAVLVDHETCLGFQGLRCEVCYRICPLLDKAITLNYRSQERTGKHAYFEPVVHSEFCTGCGMCEHGCVLEESAIRVLPLSLAKGKLGENYRFGWKEKSGISDDFGSGQMKSKKQNSSSTDDNHLRNVLDALNDDGTLYE